MKFFECKRALFVILHTGGLLYFVVRQNLSQIYAFFSVKFPGLKICECKKMTNLRYGYECRVIKICPLDCHKNCHQICHYEFHLGISERVSDKGTSQELRNCPIQRLNCRKCLLLVGRWIGLVRFGPEG